MRANNHNSFRSKDRVHGSISSCTVGPWTFIAALAFILVTTLSESYDGTDEAWARTSTEG